MASRSLDPPPEAAGAIRIADAFFQYAHQILFTRYRYTKAQIRSDGRFHYYGSPTEVDDFILRQFDALKFEPISRSVHLTQKLEKGFIDLLRRGKLTAWARHDSPFASWVRIPAQAWTHLWPHEIHKGTVRGPRDVILYDVRVGKLLAFPVPTPRRKAGASGNRIAWVQEEFLLHKEEYKKGSKGWAAKALTERYAAAHPKDLKPISAKRIRNWLGAPSEGKPLWDEE